MQQQDTQAPTQEARDLFAEITKMVDRLERIAGDSLHPELIYRIAEGMPPSDWVDTVEEWTEPPEREALAYRWGFQLRSDACEIIRPAREMHECLDTGEVACREHLPELDPTGFGPVRQIEGTRARFAVCDTCAIRDKSRDTPIMRVVLSAILAMSFEVDALAQRGLVSDMRRDAFKLELFAWAESLGLSNELPK